MKGGFLYLGRFIYFLTPDQYCSYFRRGVKKILPKRFIKKYQLKINPKVVCIYKDKNDQIKGYGLGILFTYENIDNEIYKKRICEAIKIIEDKTVNNIINNYDYLGEEEKSYIEDSFGVKILDGRSIVKNNMFQVYKKICDYRKVDIHEQEIVIISDNSDIAKDFIMELSKHIKYLTIVQKESEELEKLKRAILFSTGLAVHSIEYIGKNIENYDVIINFDDRTYLNINKIKRRAIVFDIGISRKLSKEIKKKRKNILVIKDFIFKNNSDIICDMNCLNFEKEIESCILEALGYFNHIVPIKVKIHNKGYYISQAVDTYLRLTSSPNKFARKK